MFKGKIGERKTYNAQIFLKCVCLVLHTLYLPVNSKEKRHIAVRQSWTCMLSRLLTCILVRACHCLISTGHKCMNPIDRSKNNTYSGEAIGVRLHFWKATAKM